MAQRASSPFPTSHDTLGASSYNTPLFPASSPPRVDSPYQRARSPSRKDKSTRATAANGARRRKNLSNRSASVPWSDGSESDANLSDYTFDLDKLPGREVGSDNRKGDTPKLRLEDDEKENDESSELGGPEDFTLNMVELIRGGASKDQQDEESKHEPNEKDEEPGHTMIRDEYSEFEPPLDMSTPAQVLTRRRLTNHDDTVLKSAGKSRGFREGSSKIEPVKEEPDVEDEDIRLEVERLRKDLRQKDEIIQANQRRVLDAASVAQQVRHLQSELHKQSATVKDNEARENENAAQKERIDQLETKLESKDAQLEEKQAELEKLRSLREEVALLRKDANDLQNEQQGGRAERPDLSSIRSQLEEKDKALDRASSNFQETMTAHEKKLQEKITEIDRLKSQQDEQCLELDRLDSDLDSVIRERDALLKRTGDLDRIVQHLEEQVDSLNSDLSEAKAERDSGVKALKGLASESSIAVEGQQLTDIIVSLKSHYDAIRKPVSAEGVSTGHEKSEGTEKELSEIRIQLQESTSLTRILTMQLESTREELEESKSLRSTLQKDNSQIQSKLQELQATQHKLQDDLDKVTEERDGAIHTLEGFGPQNETHQQPSPPSSPQLGSPRLKARENTAAIDHSHKIQLDSLQSAHATTLSAIKDSHTETTRNLHSLLSAAQQRETDLQAELLALRKTSSSQESEAAILKCERDKLESVIESKDAAAVAMDTKFASVLKKREEIWEARVDRLLGDRERMGKVLMWTWGEMEEGNGQTGEGRESRKLKGASTGSKPEKRQGYRYKYVQKEIDGK